MNESENLTSKQQQQHRGLAAQSLLNSEPTYEGHVLKLHIPLIYSILPSFLQRILSSKWCPFSSFLSPTWKDRHLILIGKYLYRFNNEHSKEPKGKPVSLPSLNIDIVDRRQLQLQLQQQLPPDDEITSIEPILRNLPPKIDAVFRLSSTLGKTTYYGVSNREECITWVNSLRESRQEAIVRSMGHHDRDQQQQQQRGFDGSGSGSGKPYPSSWVYFDRLGDELVKSKERIKRRLDESSVRELEMTSMEGFVSSNTGVSSDTGIYYE